MTERWVHPPVVAREAPPAWKAVWRFRLVALLVLALLVLLAVLVFRQLTGANAQDPGIGALPAAVPTAVPDLAAAPRQLLGSGPR